MIVGSIAKISKIINTTNREMYFENPTEDYFNLKKDNIKLILSKKKGDFLRHVPDYYGPIDTIGYALIRGYNCQGKCQYCYLQSYFKSPDIIKYLNTNDIVFFLKKFLDRFFEEYPEKKVILYDGDFQDSLGYAFLKRNLQQLKEILSLISNYENVFLEIRTKQIISDFKTYDIILENKYKNSLIVAITFSPKQIVENFEIGTSDLNTRIEFAKYVQNKGFKVGIRIDPIILVYNDLNKSLELYENLVNILKNQLKDELISNWGIGMLRLKKALYKKLKEEGSKLINNLIYDKGFYRYPLEVRKTVYKEFNNWLGEKLYICMDEF